MKLRTWLLTFGLLISCIHAETVPVAYKGRIRPLEAYARLWLYDIYGRQTIRSEDLTAFHTTTREPADFLWQLYLQGHEPWDDAPVFALHSKQLKAALGLDLRQHSFSYIELKKAISQHPDLLENILVQTYWTAYNDPVNRGGATRLEILPGIWVQQQNDSLTLLSTSSEEPWLHLTAPRSLPQKGSGKLLKEAFHALLQQLRTWESYTTTSESLFRALPSKRMEGEWYSLRALATASSNFTLYPDALFAKLKAESTHRQALERNLALAYQQIAGKPIKSSATRTLFYPSVWQLQAEELYYKYPFTILAIALYAIAAIAFALKFHRAAFTLLTSALLIHTFVLALRCYVLERPPVSNMFETVIYVPWIAVLCALLLRPFQRTDLTLIAGCIVSVGLLAVLQVTQLNSGLENVQAVLDSQYWLLIHVLMVVGSYGVFALCGILGHFYLGSRALGYRPEDTAKAILHSMYLGTALLIMGTILGGVWAAQSWGRFWDWDPKESWAFITACVYLLFIHAYRFHHIQDLGLAVGSVLGLMAMSFTWYGVNYILGTGLHSYGFGSGGEGFYYAFLAFETFFIGICCWRVRGQKALSF